MGTVHTHDPVRRWFTLWLWRTCSCGRWRTCPAPLWSPPARIPDGDRVPWPTNRGHWANAPTRPLNVVPLMTRGQEYRGRGWWRA